LRIFLGRTHGQQRVMSAIFAVSHDASGLPPTPESLRRSSEPTLRANFGSP
jgi:hypothetical protein